MGDTVYIAIGVASAAYVLIIVCPLVYFLCCRKRKRKNKEEAAPPGTRTSPVPVSQPGQQTTIPEPIAPSVGPDLDPLTSIPESPDSRARPIPTEDIASDATDYEDVDSQGLRASILRDKQLRDSTKRETQRDSTISNGSVVQNGGSGLLRTDSKGGAADGRPTSASLLRSAPPRARDNAAHLSTVSMDSEGEPIYSRPDLTKKLSRRSTEVKERGGAEVVPLSPIGPEPRTPALPPRPDNLLDTPLAEQQS